MKRLFLDTNVLIDFLSDRKPFSDSAAILFEASVRQKVQVFVAAISYNNIYYILNQALSHSQTLKHLTALKELTTTVPVTSDTIDSSLVSDFKDFEDAIQYYCALSVPKIDAIVTRNTKDFKKSTIAILTPQEAIGILSFQTE